MQGLGKTPREAEALLTESLERAVERGTLLRAALLTGESEQPLYFLNSPKGRAAVAAIQQGKWRPSGDPQVPVELGFERPSIFRLYEQNIGPLTPMLAEMLKEAEQLYPPDWIEDAIRIAVENNKRSWRYTEAILRRWQEKGRDERKAPDRRDTEKDRRRYADWEDA
jgi:DnaD/phage-associated family protein